MEAPGQLASLPSPKSGPGYRHVTLIYLPNVLNALSNNKGFDQICMLKCLFLPILGLCTIRVAILKPMKTWTRT